MQYKEYHFSKNTPSELPADIYLPLLSNALAELGFDSFVEQEDGSLTAYLSECYFNQIEEKGTYRLLFPEMLFNYNSSLCAEENWNKRWEEESFTPIEIENKLLIRSPRHSFFAHTVEQEVLIEPSCAFGTGSHSTTRLMLRLLLEENLQEKKVLDVGCGTGVLGITALLRGAKQAIFIDIDSLATDNTAHNLALNNIAPERDCKVYTGILDNFDFPLHSVDILCANIHRNAIIGDAPKYYSLLDHSGFLFISGFLRDDEELMEKHLTSLGFSLRHSLVEEEWCAMCFRIAQN